MRRKIEQYRNMVPSHMASNLSRVALYHYIADSRDDIFELYNRNILRPMSIAPRDGTEILAYHNSGNFYPVTWKPESVTSARLGLEGYWNMRWHIEYKQYNADFMGWIPMPVPVR